MAVPSVLATVLSPETPPPPSSRSYCCERTVCGRKWSGVDYVFILGEISGCGLMIVGGSAYALKASAAVSITGGLGGVALLAMSLLGHVTWRRAKPLLNVNDAEIGLRETDRVLNQGVVAAEQQVAALTHRVSELDRVEDRVREGAHRVDQTHQQLVVDHQRFQGQHAVYQQREETLRAQNRELEAQIQNLTASLAQMNAYLNTLHQRSAAFKRQIELGSGFTEALGQEERRLAADIEQLKTHLDPSIAALARNVEGTHQVFAEIILLQGQRTEDLKIQVDRLHADLGRLETVDATLAGRQEEVSRLLQQEEVLSQRISSLEHHLDEIQKQLQESSSIMQRLQGAEGALHQDGEGLAQTQSGLEATLSQLENLMGRATAVLASRGDETS